MTAFTATEVSDLCVFLGMKLKGLKPKMTFEMTDIGYT